MPIVNEALWQLLLTERTVSKEALGQALLALGPDRSQKARDTAREHVKRALDGYQKVDSPLKQARP